MTASSANTPSVSRTIQKSTGLSLRSSRCIHRRIGMKRLRSGQ